MTPETDRLVNIPVSVLRCRRCGRVSPDVVVERQYIGGRGYQIVHECRPGTCPAETAQPPVLRCDGCGNVSADVRAEAIGSNGRQSLVLQFCRDRAACLERGRAEGARHG